MVWTQHLEELSLPSIMAPVGNMLGRVPLFPLFLNGDPTPIIQHHMMNQ